jgi:hypothetical protein
MSKNLKNKIAEGGLAILFVIIIWALCYGCSWIVTCGIIKLITMCFGLNFKWSVATGIWLVICILRSIFNVTVKNK